MATRALLAELSRVAERRLPVSVQFESGGGIEVARSIRSGEHADLAVLGEQEMAELEAEGHFEPGTLRPLFVSDVVAAVPEHAAPVPFSTEDDLRAALAGADRVAFSTGPSGSALVELIERWQLIDTVRSKLVQAPPGVPVGSLLAGGDAELGFQQRSEFAGVAGIRVLGPLPGGAAIRSTFSGAVLAGSADPDAARAVLRFLGSAEAEGHVRRAGMTTVRR